MTERKDPAGITAGDITSSGGVEAIKRIKPHSREETNRRYVEILDTRSDQLILNHV